VPDLTHPSPNHSARPPGVAPRLIVLHADAGQSDAGTLAWCADPASKVSYHALVGRRGSLYTLVPFTRKAWHAGVSAWQGIANVNDFSLGFAFANRHDGAEPLTPGQIDVMLGLVEGWARGVVTLEAVTTHADVSPGRKTDPLKCPGFHFPDYEAAFARGVAARRIAA
jgi:N-acetylmuramoyl-L-alanine amidase